MSTGKKTSKPTKGAGNSVAKPKKPYATPRLTTYGSIEKLTKTGGKTTKDKVGQKKH